MVTEHLIDFLLNNKRFHRVLKIMLTVGNILNSGSARTGAYGIRLKTLQKFYDTKDNNGKPVMQSVYEILETCTDGDYDEEKFE